MTGPQLKHWRESQDMSLRTLAEDILGKEVTHSTLSRWEASAEPIPKWASDTLLKITQVSLPLQDLHDLLNAAKDDKINFQELLALCIREHLERRRQNKEQEAPPDTTTRETEIGGHKVKIIGPTKYTPPPEQQNRAAEDPPAT